MKIFVVSIAVILMMGAQPSPPVLIGEAPPGISTPALRVQPGPSQCEVKLATKTCADTDVHCPASLQAIQTAINESLPGDAICIRGGTYQCNAEPCLSISGSNNGELGNFKTLSSYPGENVTIKGLGSESAWAGISLSKPSVGGNQVGLIVSGDFWHINSFRMEWFGETWMSIEGDYVTVENMDLQYAFRFGLQIGAGDAQSDNEDVLNTSVRWNRIGNVYHHSGIYVLPGSTNPNKVLDVNVAHNLLYNLGYEANGNIVPGVPGDSVGGGNADGITVENQCANQGKQYCIGGTIAYNIVINPADDCYDHAGQNYDFIGNIGISCGPRGGRGIKFWTPEPGNRVIGNFMHGGSDNTISMGFELRNEGGVDVINNLFLYSTNKGFLGFGSAVAINNVSAFSSSAEFFDFQSSENNWDGDQQGAPDLVGCGQDLNLPPLNELPVIESVSNTYSVITDQCKPSANSALIDAGVIVPGVHCSADADPLDTTCIHWNGVAPDLGAFER